ncbi:rhoptry kinase family protein ROP27 [Besnoitia besnoiti]|uniref:Rhoptry kinase family protein ROP27 n=1 Tax=Besnoitia besnoiti TaxID=94643 RepID=A0A2A9M8P1_BESBE|nr:rhoptry kinase family protein ROP27 [Besnoitia besnoiti]PFH34279.1 rhoptry kinase family protein ROP27 [Besnoitia besnoiti]
MKWAATGASGVGCWPTWLVKPLGLAMLLLLVFLVSEVCFLWRLQQIDPESPSRLPYVVSSGTPSLRSPEPSPYSPRVSEVLPYGSSPSDQKEALRLLENITGKGSARAANTGHEPSVRRRAAAVAERLRDTLPSVSPTLSADISTKSPRLRAAQTGNSPPSHSPPEADGRGAASSPSSVPWPSPEGLPASSKQSPGLVSPNALEVSADLHASPSSLPAASTAESAPAVSLDSRASGSARQGEEETAGRGRRENGGSREQINGQSKKTEAALSGNRSPARLEEEEQLEDLLALGKLTEDDAALLRLPDLLLSQNNTLFQVQFLSDAERKRFEEKRSRSSHPTTRKAKKRRPEHASSSGSSSPRRTSHKGDVDRRQRGGRNFHAVAAVSFPAGGQADPYYGVYAGFQKPESVAAFPSFPPLAEADLAYGDARLLLPQVETVGLARRAGSAERRLKNEGEVDGDEPEGDRRDSLSPYASPVENDEPDAGAPTAATESPVGEEARGGGLPAAAEGAAAAEARGDDSEKQEAATQGPETRAEETKKQAGETPGEHAHRSYQDARVFTRSVVGNSALRHEVRESGARLTNIVAALSDFDRSNDELSGRGDVDGRVAPIEDEESQLGSPAGPAHPLRLADLPEVIFSKPSRSLVKAAEGMEKTGLPQEKEKLARIIPFDRPFEVRSLATQKKRALIFEDVLGAGGQGIVVLARDANSPDVQMAVKIFRITKKNRANTALLEISRLQRRLRWETAILKYAPKDISSYVWSQLAHLVMPLDIVEPVEKLETPPDEPMRYWHQWVIFEHFAGDITRLRKLRSGSGQARLDASKQMFMACLRLHDTGMVHSDIKLANYFISSEGRVFLGDYSLSRPIGDVSPCVEGTLRFLPPENMECIRDHQKNLILSPKKDTWAVGVALYKLWCRNLFPFQLDTLQSDEVIGRVAEVTQSDLDFYPCSPNMPTAMIDLIMRMLDPNIETRPTLRELFVSHPVFTELRKVILRYTLSDLLAEQAGQ